MHAIILLAAFCAAVGLCITNNTAYPTCVSICTGISLDPCRSDALPAFVSCLDAECSANSALSRYSVTYSPRVEFSCQQSYIPGDSSVPAQVRLSGLGRCASSPYDFQSFVASAGNDSTLANICRMNLYPESHCVGAPVELTIFDSFERCYFHGGRSARLDCTPGADATTTLRYVRDICGDSSVSRLLKSTSSYRYNATSGQSYGSNSSNRTDMAAPFVDVGLMPYISSATEKKSDARIAALFAVVAAIVIL